MDLRQLEYVIAIADNGSLTKAARMLYITHSALSQQLTKLENNLGVALFDRADGKLTPTRAGKLYIDASREILAIKELAYKQIDDISQTHATSFTLGLTSGRARYMFADLFMQFKKTYPDYKIKLVENTIAGLTEMTLAGQIDLMIGSRPHDHPDLACKLLGKEAYVIAMPHNHPLIEKAEYDPDGSYLGIIDLKLFKNENFSLMDYSSPIRSVADEMFKNAGFKPKILFESSNASLLCNFSKTQACVALVPMHYAKGHSDYNQLSYLFTQPLGVYEVSAIYKRTGQYIPKPVNHFIKIAKTYYENFWKTNYPYGE